MKLTRTDPSDGAEAAVEPMAPKEEELIPVIDFTHLTTGTPEQQSQALRDLAKACEDWGCFVMVNHGVPERLMVAMVGALEGFFELGEEEKREYEGKGVLDPIRCGTGFNSVDEVRYWRDFLKTKLHPEFHSPDKPPGFREILQDYASWTRGLARDLLRYIWDSLELEKNSIDNALDLDSCLQLFVGNLYPPSPQPELSIGLPAHTDHGLLTLLIQNGVDGLQIKHNDQWINIRPQPNYFFINIGDQIEIISNGRFKSVVHRARVNGESARMSIVTVIGPALETVVVPAPQLVSQQGGSMVYRGMKYEEYFHHQQSNMLKERELLNLLRVSAEQ